MKGAIHIVAVSARTPVGLTAEGSAAAARARISRIAEHPFMVDLRGEPVRVARDGQLDPMSFGRDRLQGLGQAALDALWDKLAASRVPTTPIPLLLGLPASRYAWHTQDAQWLGATLAGRDADRWQPRVLPTGHAAALDAMRQAIIVLRAGEAALCVVGGIDSYVDPDALLWIDDQQQLHADHIRSGFAPGEAASFVALATDAGLRHLGRRPLAWLHSVGCATDPPAAQEHNLGEGLSQAIFGAIRSLPASLPTGLRAQDARIDDVYCDLNGERWRTEEWGFALLRTQHAFRDATVYHTGTDAWGDVGAASGALSVVLAVVAWQRGYARGPLAMTWGSSVQGLRAAAILQQAEGARS